VLAKCPFCGDDRRILRFHDGNEFHSAGWHYICKYCGASGPIVNSKFGAGEAWSTRS